MAIFTQAEMARIQWLAIIHFEKSNPTERWYIPALPPGIPIATSAMYWRPNHFREMLEGMPDTFFNRIGTFRAKNPNSKYRDMIFAAFVFWRRLCFAARRIRGQIPKTQLTNQKYSQLYKLPVELLLLIGEQLPPVSQLCLRRVCSKFWTCLERLGLRLDNDIFLRTEILQFNVLLKHDERIRLLRQYTLNCKSANPNAQLSRRGCSGCLKIHESIDDFTATALTLSPMDRVCVGLQGSINICEHISFSAECLLQGLHAFHQLEIYCQQHTKVRSIYGDRCYDLERNATYRPRIAFYDGIRVTIDRRFYLFSAPVGKDFTHQELFEALQVIDGAICPHLRTSSSYLCQEIELTAECSLGMKDDSNKRNWFRRCGRMAQCRSDTENCIIWSKCPNSDCDTWFGLRRIHTLFFPLHHFILEVKRKFLGDPTHSSWKAQFKSMEGGMEVIQKSSKCDARRVHCKGPVCTARHHGLVITPFDTESTKCIETTNV